MVNREGLEPPTRCVQNSRSANLELSAQFAGPELVRGSTDDLQVPSLVLLQLSYSPGPGHDFTT